MMGEIPRKFSEPLALKLLVGSEKVWGLQKLYGHTLSACKVGGERRLETKKQLYSHYANCRSVARLDHKLGENYEILV